MVFLLVVFVCLNVSAAEWMVPAAAHAPGAGGTNWRTDLRVVNPSGAAADVRIDLLPQNSDNGARSRSVTVSVPAQGQLSLNDVLESRFQFTGNAALLVGSSEASLVVTSRTFNEASGGATYGQFIPGVSSAQALGAGVTGHLIYLSKTVDYRTNVGFAGTTGGAGKVFVRLYDAAGQSIGSGAFDVQPYGQSQINDVFAATNAPALAVARAEVTSTVPVIAYASIIDNRTGDPIAIVAARESEAAGELAIPAVARLAGAGGSLWRSDVRIFNLSGGDDDDNGGGVLTLTYYPGNTPNPTPVTRTVSIGRGELLALDDILLRTFGLDNASGALRIQSGGQLLVTSRTYNQSGTGTFGQDIPSVSTAQALPGSATSLYSGLSDSGYRTNVGFFNLTSNPLDLTLTLKRPDGSAITSKGFHLDGNMQTQINLFDFLGAGGTASASLAISGSGSNTYTAYASVIDNRSGDPVYVPATRSTAAATGNPGGNPGNPSGQCVTLPFMRAGLKLGYRASDNSYSSQQTVIADGPTQTVLHDDAVAGGVSEKIDTTVDFVMQGDVRAATHMLSKATVSVGGFGTTINTDITFSPAVAVGPLTFCADATFPINASAQTTTVSGVPGGGTTVYNRPADTGKVLAVHESLAVAGGTFDTVKYRSTQGATSASVAYSIVWYDIASGALVRQEEYNSGGGKVLTLDLTSIQ
ncbi:MAG TPA: hypothetical protein VJ276_02990 [Thermoanaerobaculia bacterium]|nr:hypothetical protein [Thermoanaerobaculia bacterium]